MPLLDFEDADEYDAAVTFLVRRGLPFHASPPQCLTVRGPDYKVLVKAKLLPSSPVKVNGSRGKKARSSSKPKTGGAR